VLNEAMDKHRAGDYAGAESLYRKMLSDEPENFELLHLLGIARMEQGDLTDAYANVSKAIELQPSGAAFMVTLATIEHRRGQLVPAVEHMKQAIALNPNLPQSHNTLGYLQFLTGDIEAAETTLTIARRLEPESHRVMVNLGQVKLSMGDLDRAIAYFQDALEIQPNDLAALSSLGEAFLFKGTPAFAEECFSKCLQQRPDSIKLQNLLAQSKLAAGQVDEADSMFKTILETRPEQFEALVGQADVAVFRMQYEQAVRQYQNALTVQRGHPLVVEKLADCLLAIGDGLTAARCYQALIDEDSPVGRIHAKLGRALLEAGQLNEAEGYLTNALSANPDDLQLLLNTAQLREAQGRDDDAIAVLHKGLDGSADPVVIRSSLASLYLAAGQPDQALETLRPLGDPDDAQMHLHVEGLRLRACDAMGDHAAASGHADALSKAELKPVAIQQAVDPKLLASWPDEPLDDDRGEPVFVVGLPGSGVAQIAAMLDDLDTIEVIDDRFAGDSERNDLFSQPSDHAALDGFAEDEVRRARRRYWNGWQRLRKKVADRVLGIDYLPVEQLDVASLCRIFPKATLLVVNRASEDLWLHGRLTGWSLGYRLESDAIDRFNQQIDLARESTQLNVIEINGVDEQPAAVEALQALLEFHQIRHPDLSELLDQQWQRHARIQPYFAAGHADHYKGLMDDLASRH